MISVVDLEGGRNAVTIKDPVQLAITGCQSILVPYVYTDAQRL